MEKIKYALLQSAWVLLSKIPLPVLYCLSDLLFYPLYYIIRYRRRITRKNLLESFPEKSRKEITGIEKRFYHFFTDYFFETCKMATFSTEEIKRRMQFDNVAEIEGLLQAKTSISLYLGHYCNWEWVSSLPVNYDVPALSGQVYHKLHNAYADKLFLRNRSRFGAINIEMRDTLRWIHSNRKEEKTLITGYIADQAPKSNSIHHWIRFLNHTTPALTGAEKITKRYDFKAYYLHIRRVKRGYYRAGFVLLHDNPQTLPDFELTDLYFKQLEKTIRDCPEYYLWSHNRFKYQRPESSPA
ncbi:MAG: lysophospholipid acyltransferase family protein [Dysgonamonadaceae bacterium]|jgi:KDO2-lipid IV(A) lauroyltransferase|nr:lysophospholipid acyltransferase family protein [Dysgonamonadaceae bacterium]